MTIVSDSGPLISFARIKQLTLLKQTLNEINIPTAVYEDIVLQGKAKPGAKEVEEANWILKDTVKNLSQINQLPLNLGLGEREAIVLAKELEALLLIDDRPARKTAEIHGIICFGSLRILKDAKEKGFIKKVKPICNELIRAGLRIKNSLYQEFLQVMDE